MWACRDLFAGHRIEIDALRFRGTTTVSHVYAVTSDWAFDRSGWNMETEMIAANERFEGRPLDRVRICVDLPTFCEQQHHRMPDQYWSDPRPRAEDYVPHFEPPWA